jgi:hypothetical protein
VKASVVMNSFCRTWVSFSIENLWSHVIGDVPDHIVQVRRDEIVTRLFPGRKDAGVFKRAEIGINARESSL